MKAFWREHKNKNAFLWGLAGLLAVWCLWYSRPVDIHFLLGTAQPDCASGLVIKDVGSPWKSRKERSFRIRESARPPLSFGTLVEDIASPGWSQHNNKV